MPKIIMLERNGTNPLQIRYALWADVPVSRQTFYADATKRSEWKDVTASQLTAIQSGAVVERVESQGWPENTPIASIQKAMEAAHTAFQDEISGRNDWVLYGTSWNGITWTNSGVA